MKLVVLDPFQPDKPRPHPTRCFEETMPPSRPDPATIEIDLTALQEVPLKLLDPRADQPRRDAAGADVAALAADIARRGKILQPINSRSHSSRASRSFSVASSSAWISAGVGRVVVITRRPPAGG